MCETPLSLNKTTLPYSGKNRSTRLYRASLALSARVCCIFPVFNSRSTDRRNVFSRCSEPVSIFVREFQTHGNRWGFGDNYPLQKTWNKVKKTIKFCSITCKRAELVIRFFSNWTLSDESWNDTINVFLATCSYGHDLFTSVHYGLVEARFDDL